jgi:DNA-directed RNA polymerase subunit RPC12/RpoP
MLDLKCDQCGRELQEPGALVFSPPKGQGWLVEKYHLCVDCWAQIAEQVRKGKRLTDHDPQ